MFCADSLLCSYGLNEFLRVFAEHDLRNGTLKKNRENKWSSAQYTFKVCENMYLNFVGWSVMNVIQWYCVFIAWSISLFAAAEVKLFRSLTHSHVSVYRETRYGYNATKFILLNIFA